VKKVSILIVEDDATLRAELSDFLEARGYQVAAAAEVASARQLLAREKPDLCLTDIMLPGASGKVLCRELAEHSDCGVIMMSSLSDDDTIVTLLDMGADDYLVKPFGFAEALARIRAVLRRRAIAHPAVKSGDIAIGAWVFEMQAKRLTGEGGLVRPLTQSEAAVLRFLALSPGTAFSREDLLAVSRTRQHGGSDDRSVDALIKRLRKKLEADPAAPLHITTVWGKGYRFEP
jgi:DNA-binding response OmpR family regulator